MACLTLATAAQAQNFPRYAHSNGAIENKAVMVENAVASPTTYRAMNTEKISMTIVDNTAIARHLFTATQIDKDGKEAPLHLDACNRIREAAHRHGKKACMHCASAAFAVDAVKRGFDLVMLTSDVSSMVAGAKRQLDEFRAAVS